jgi:hypothetical protein
MPGSGGIARKNVRNDGRLLVEPPRPTTGSVSYPRLGTTSSSTPAWSSSVWSGSIGNRRRYAEGAPEVPPPASSMIVTRFCAGTSDNAAWIDPR